MRPFQCRQGHGKPVKNAGFSRARAARALGGLDVLPGAFLRPRILLGLCAENVRMAAQHLVADAARDVVEIEGAGLLGHAGMKHHLEQQVAELVAQILQIIAGNGVCDFIGFLDRVWRDRREVLIDVPGAAFLWIPEPGHYLK